MVLEQNPKKHALFKSRPGLPLPVGRVNLGVAASGYGISDFVPHPGDKLGIYVSIPFCRSKCTYCNFASGVFPAGEHTRYMQHLLPIWKAVRDTGVHSMPFSTTTRFSVVDLAEPRVGEVHDVEPGAGQVDVLEPGAGQVLAREIGHLTRLPQRTDSRSGPPAAAAGPPARARSPAALFLIWS